MNKIFINIKELCGILENQEKPLGGDEANSLKTIKNAYLEIVDGKIASYGKMDDLEVSAAQEIIDAKDKLILPCWMDSHTHLVFAGTREGEFIDRINGLTYEEIAAKGGGILNSAERLKKTSEDDLFYDAEKRLLEVMNLGTGGIEIKSGYGLTLEGELKMLRVIKRLKEKYELPIKSTFLGAHAVPKDFKNQKEKYIDLITNEMLPNIHKEKLADYIDVFCETNYFSVDEMDKILLAGKKYGLKPKVHVNQFTSIGGIQKAIEHDAVSVDHLEVLSEDDINSLRSDNIIPTLLPSCSFFINIPYSPAKKLIHQHIPFALATDYNPGSSPNGNMNLVIALACIKMNISPEAAINAATINSAYAMEIQDEYGSISVGKWANINLTNNINSYGFLPYSFGTNHIYKTMIKGKWIN
ncbi:MAG: imidazolonepropionase [Bacteroidota bacterium]|nr:imidazolonepropionase [Bacteroidota bacterium]